MHSDVVELRDFYDSALGRVVQRMIRRRVRRIWPDVRGDTILGLGYATPFLRPFREEADRVLAAMPARQGVVAWPREGRRLVTLADETYLPFADMSIDRIVLVHGMELTEDLRNLMREIWRVLNGNGRLLTVVPNRRGVWARVDRTPFGQGHPYSTPQLTRVLRESLFVPQQTDRALFFPPMRSQVLLRAAPAWEEVGARWFTAFAGVVMIEASKQLYQVRPVGAKSSQRRPVLVPIPKAIPARTTTPRRGDGVDGYSDDGFSEAVTRLPDPATR